MSSTRSNGIFTAEANLTQEEMDADRPILADIMAAIPPEAELRRLEIWVNGRLYEYERLRELR